MKPKSRKLMSALEKDIRRRHGKMIDAGLMTLHVYGDWGYSLSLNVAIPASAVLAALDATNAVKERG